MITNITRFIARKAYIEDYHQIRHVCGYRPARQESFISPVKLLDIEQQ